jgi:hypothetical protein
MFTITDELQAIGNNLTQRIKDELTAQGHVATGGLLNSIRADVSGAAIKGFAEDYSVFVNNRSRPHGFNRQGIENLKAWLRVKGISQDALWPIIKTIQKQGTPTSGSYRFSKNGRRTDFVSHVLNEKREELTKDVNEKLLNALGRSISDILDKQKILR